VRLAAAAAIPLAFVLLVVAFYPFRYRFEFDPDEGVNAIKAFLLVRGYRLYFDVWSDQPPVFTFVLAAWLRTFGWKVAAGRLLVLVFSAGLLAVAGAYLRRSWGWLAALAAAVILLLLPFYPQLSVSMMIGLPSIALALGSFSCLAQWHLHHRSVWLIFSAVLLVLSILTKLFTVILVPVWLAGIALDLRRRAMPNAGIRRWSPALLWSGVLLCLGSALVLWGVGLGNVGQLLDVHLAAARDPTIAAWSRLPSIQSYLAPSLPIFLLAAIGTWRAVRAKAGSALYLAGWAAAGYGFLSANNPTWYHHQLLITVPAALLASIAVAAAGRDLRAWRARRPAEVLLSLTALAVLTVFLAGRLPPTLADFDTRLPNLSAPAVVATEEQQILALMWDHAGDSEWVYSDRPMFAFVIQRPVPPVLAVLTEKRIATGALPEAEVLAALEEYAPRLVLTGQLPVPAVEEYMRTRNFRRIDSAFRYRLYFRPITP
jgi:4-amino-4-deoxy-L-arabinose transferase-like glycosyltransferase